MSDPTDRAYIELLRKLLVADDAHVLRTGEGFAIVRCVDGTTRTIAHSDARTSQARIDAANEVTDEMVEVAVKTFFEECNDPEETATEGFRRILEAALKARHA